MQIWAKVIFALADGAEPALNVHEAPIDRRAIEHSSPNRMEIPFHCSLFFKRPTAPVSVTKFGHKDFRVCAPHKGVLRRNEEFKDSWKKVLEFFDSSPSVKGVRSIFAKMLATEFSE